MGVRKDQAASQNDVKQPNEDNKVEATFTMG